MLCGLGTARRWRAAGTGELKAPMAGSVPGVNRRSAVSRERWCEEKEEEKEKRHKSAKEEMSLEVGALMTKTAAGLCAVSDPTNGSGWMQGRQIVLGGCGV